MGRTVKPNILLVVMDAVRADHLSLYGHRRNTTPNLCELSRESTVFANAISSSAWTLPSIASILTGLYPSEHGATQESLRLNEEVDTLAEILSRYGYFTLGVTSNAWISHSTGLSRGFADFKDWRDIRIGSLYRGLPNLLRTHEALKSLLYYPALFFARYVIRKSLTVLITEYVKRYMLENKNELGNPHFIFIHLLDAHLPYNSSYAHVFLSKSEMKMAATLNREWKAVRARSWAGIDISEEGLNVLNKLYDSAIFSLDSRIADLVNFLREQEILDDTLLIITSDHGENLGDHRLIDHQFCLYDTLVKVPLIVRYPPHFPKGKIVDRQIELRSIFQTVLHIADNSTDMRYYSSGETSDLISELERDESESEAFGEYSKPSMCLDILSKYCPASKIPDRFKCKSKFLRKDGFKYIWHENGVEELYDLRLDPHEKNNIVCENSRVRESMKKLLAKKMKDISSTSSCKESLNLRDRSIGRQIKRRLQALGYFE